MQAQAKYDPRSSRGFLNNNPGNVDRSGEVWQGEIRDPADPRLTDFQRNELTKGRFCVFAQPQLGIRMLAKTLFAYRDRLGHRTVRQIINTWAPPVENDTGSYVNIVAGKVGVSPDAEIDVRDWKTLHALVSAIIVHECGGMPYAGSEIEDGLMLAGVVKPVGVTTSKTATGLTVASGATIGGAAVSSVQEALKPTTTIPVAVPAPPPPTPAPDFGSAVAGTQDSIRQAADALVPFAGTSQTIDHVLFGLKIAMALVALVGIGLAIRERIRRSRRDELLAAATQESGL